MVFSTDLSLEVKVGSDLRKEMFSINQFLSRQAPLQRLSAGHRPMLDGLPPREGRQIQGTDHLGFWGWNV